MKITIKQLRRLIREALEQDVSAACTIMFNENDEVLLLRRGMTAPWMPGKWNLPGGTVEPGESTKVTAIREAQEETSVRLKKLTLVSDTISDGYRVHVFVCKFGDWQGPAILDLEENDAMKWVHIDEASQEDLVPGLPEAIDQVARSMRR